MINHFYALTLKAYLTYPCLLFASKLFLFSSSALAISILSWSWYMVDTLEMYWSLIMTEVCFRGMVSDFLDMRANSCLARAVCLFASWICLALYLVRNWTNLGRPLDKQDMSALDTSRAEGRCTSFLSRRSVG